MPREQDRQKFVRLANARVNRAIDAIRLIGNLSNRSNYVFLDSDVERIFRTLNGELKSCRQKFEGPEGRAAKKFSLD
jgi:hypothetical protein